MPIRKVRLGILGYPVYFYSATQVQRLMVEAGFAVKRMDRLGAIYCVLGIPDGNGQP